MERAPFSLRAQLPTADTTFEVASIRPNDDTAPGSMHIEMLEGGRFRATNASVKMLIRNAFDLQSFQLEGAPAWLDAVKFDVNAKTVGSARITTEHLKPLLRNLLAERFGFKYHTETRNLTVYSLAVTKAVQKIMASTVDPGSSQGPSITGTNNNGNAQIVAKQVSMAGLARELSGQLQTIISDDTGLEGVFDFSLRWSFNPSVDSLYPSIFSALKDQLGLRLESGKGPVQIIVVDHVERTPTAN